MAGCVAAGTALMAFTLPQAWCACRRKGAAAMLPGQRRVITFMHSFQAVRVMFGGSCFLLLQERPEVSGRRTAWRGNRTGTVACALR